MKYIDVNNYRVIKKINRIKMIICSYIKEKELDVFFDKLLINLPIGISIKLIPAFMLIASP